VWSSGTGSFTSINGCGSTRAASVKGPGRRVDHPTNLPLVSICSNAALG
jgi:hypothetical protein